MGSAVAGGALAADVAFDGWVGAVLGALASIAVAVFVLRRTLRHDRDQFDAQLSEERTRFAEELERERSLGLEQRRMEAFADYLAELTEYRMYPYDWSTRRDLERRVRMAVQRWAMFVSPSDAAFLASVERSAESVIRSANQNLELREVQGGWYDEAGEEIEPTAVGDRRTTGYVNGIALWGRAWHVDPDGRDAAEQWFQSEFPEEKTTGPSKRKARTDQSPLPG
ncbi:hypothetical protein [Cellulomonas dongxiuzhuiae]|uniref:hypothetical protein n=1 Tax=Cellulomonas dongxiuzhuiae TaxID=2819979 RepID=UPI001AAF7990|nr:hypothetical protein [Cellulomonas dongxiuzhuiae]MBO3090020.1 hypothetical protein [Cellulomonas dongxiuzhuiae]